MNISPYSHRVRVTPTVCDRIVQFGRCETGEGAVAVETSCNQDLAVRQQRGGVKLARDAHARCGRPCARNRIIYLGGGTRRGTVCSADRQDSPVREPRRRVAESSVVHAAGAGPTLRCRAVGKREDIEDDRHARKQACEVSDGGFQGGFLSARFGKWLDNVRVQVPRPSSIQAAAT